MLGVSKTCPWHRRGWRPPRPFAWMLRGRRFCESLIGRLPLEAQPVMRRGFDPAFDVPIEDE